MKAPKPKTHLLDVAEPLLAYHELEMRCGLVLKNAKPKFMTTGDWMEELILNTLETCRKCVAAKPEGEEQRTYVYWLVEAQEERDFVEEAA